MYVFVQRMSLTDKTNNKRLDILKNTECYEKFYTSCYNLSSSFSPVEMGKGLESFITHKITILTTICIKKTSIGTDLKIIKN